jgi:hypothetical protein
VGSSTSNSKVVVTARGESSDAGAGGGADVLVVQLARVVGAVIGQGSRVGVVDVGGMRVELGAEGRRIADLHVGSGQLAAGKEGEDAGGDAVGEHFVVSVWYLCRRVVVQSRAQKGRIGK